MTNILKEYFPMIRTKEEILETIKKDAQLQETYEKWNEEQRKSFLDMLTGKRGVKVLYDCFFKEIMNPELTPERPEEFLSLVMGQKVKILKVLPLESPRFGDETSLIVMDVVVELENHSIVIWKCRRLAIVFPENGARATRQICC